MMTPRGGDLQRAFGAFLAADIGQARGLGTVDDLAGPAALYRLKQEMLARINLAVDPSRIDDVLFKEMLVQ